MAEAGVGVRMKGRVEAEMDLMAEAGVEAGMVTWILGRAILSRKTISSQRGANC